MLALIDGDIVAYRCAAASENDTKEVAILRVDSLMRSIVTDVTAAKYKCFLTGSNNFRKEIYPEYKANRKDKSLPKYLNACREFLVLEWNSSITDGHEADDALGINQIYHKESKNCGYDRNGSHSKESYVCTCGFEYTQKTVICSIDKDLLQIPGLHYNFVTKQAQEIEELDGIKHFWKQMLIGDTSDNIKGIDKIGKVKAEKIITPIEHHTEMYDIVSALYQDQDRFYMNADCLWVWRNENERFSNIWPRKNTEVNLKKM